jgi:hypothetical protein
MMCGFVELLIMTRILFVFAALLPAAWLPAQVLPQVPPERVGISLDRLNRIRPAMERDIANGEMAGGVGLIARRGQIAYFDTWGIGLAVSHSEPANVVHR